jgi:hypothetical protein
MQVAFSLPCNLAEGLITRDGEYSIISAFSVFTVSVGFMKVLPVAR